MAKIRGWKFPIQIDPDTGRIMTVEDNENIKQSVKVILRTQMFERKIVGSFGTNVKALTFEVVDPGFVEALKTSVESALKRWQKHIKDLNVSVKTDGGAVSKVEAVIDYITDVTPVQERVTDDLNVHG